MVSRESLLDGFIRYRWPVIGLFLGLTVAGAWFARYFEIDASAESLLVENNRLYIESRIYAQRFEPDEFVLVGYRPHSGDLYSEQSLADIRAMTDAFSGIERVATVNSLVNVPLISGAQDFDTGFDPAQYTWEAQRYSAQEMRRIFDEHPIFTDLLVNADQTATAIQIVFERNEELDRLDEDILALQRQRLDAGLSPARETELEALNREAEAVRDELAARRSREIDAIYDISADYEDRADIYPGGNYILVEHLVDIISSDLVVFGAAIAAAIVVLLAAAFRASSWVLIPVLCCAVSVIVTVGLFGLLGFSTTVISSNFIALQLILTLAIVIHLVVQYQLLALEHGGMDHHALLKKTIRMKAGPCFYAGLTTSIGFASLLFSNLQPVISFGWMMIVAMAVSIGVSLVLFPSVLALVRSRLGHADHGVIAGVLNGVHGLCCRFPWPIVAVSVVITGIVGAGILRLDAENSFLDYFRESTQVHRELSFIDRELGGSTPLDIIYHPAGNTGDLVVSAEQVQTLQRIQASLDTSAAVGKTMSIVNYTELARAMNDGQPLTEYEVSTIYRIIDRDLRNELLGDYLDEESGDLRLNARIIDSTPGLDRQAFLQALEDTMAGLGIDESQYTMTNFFVLYQDILQRLYSSQLLTMGLVYAALGLVMLLVFRSLPVALVALLPNVFTTLIVLGFMGWAGIPLDLMTITITAIAMGIAVDNTIHFTHRYRGSGESGRGGALRDAYNSVGYALVFTSGIVALGFSTLGFSDFVPSVLFGLLTAMAMVVALVLNLTLLPALLLKFVDSGGGQSDGSR